MPSLRTLLVLARASNVTTVWSNCLAAWWLGGGGHMGVLLTLLAGTTLLYTGGMFLNDAVDVEFDRQYRRERPVPAGQISEKQVWRSGLGLLGVGALILILLGAFAGVQDPPQVQEASPGNTAGSVASRTTTAPELRAPSEVSLPVGGTKPGPPAEQEPFHVSGQSGLLQSGWWAAPQMPGIRHPATTAVLTVALVGCIVLYDLLHKLVTFSPVLMGGCRLLLFLVAASVGNAGLTGLAVWSGLALGCYVAGLSFFARIERMLRRPEWWPCLLLAAPIGLGWLVNAGPFRRDARWLMLVLGLWLLRALRPALGSQQQNVSRSVTALLAGIVLVDLLAVCGAPKEISAVFLALFGATLLFQRFVPAT